MCLIGSIKAYLCPNMINFNALDFSEHRSEEVIILLTFSVVLVDLNEFSSIFYEVQNSHSRRQKTISNPPQNHFKRQIEVQQ